jgi:glycerophosphoryl diester phosphodiesterase
MTKRNIISWHSDAPLVIAHRGASLQAPENTIAAFCLAADLGADAIEMDAKLTADDRVVLHHDLRLERTTNGTGRVKSWKLNEIKQLDAGEKFDVSFRNERIPTLEEVIEAVGDRLLLNIELTNYASPFDALPDIVVRIIRQYGIQGSVLISSFNPKALLRVRKIEPEIQCGLLIKSSEPRCLRRLLRIVVAHDAVHPSFGILGQNEMEEYKRSGKRVFVWTVNLYEDVIQMLRLGVDGIITDDPGFVRGIITRGWQ